MPRRSETPAPETTRADDTPASGPAGSHLAAGRAAERASRIVFWIAAYLFLAYLFVKAYELVASDVLLPAQRIDFVAFWAAAKLAIVAALAASLPYFFWEMAMFFKPGMKPSERKYMYLLAPSALVMFAVGATFAHLILIPRLFQFMLWLQRELAAPEITIASRLDRHSSSSRSSPSWVSFTLISVSRPASEIRSSMSW